MYWYVKFLGLIFLLLSLSSCGGGGGNPSSESTLGNEVDNAYTGSRTKAVLTRSNGMEFVQVFLGRDLSSEIIDFSAANRREGLNSLKTQQVINDLSKVITTNQRDEIYLGRTANETENCSSGGSISVNGEVDDITNIGQLTMTMNNCIEDGVTTNGSMTVDITRFNKQFNEPSAYAVSFNDLTMSFAGNIYTVIGSQSYDEIQRNTDGFHNTLVTNMLQIDANGKQVFVENLKVVDGQIFTGKLFLGDYGYVVITTPEGVGIDPLSNNFIYTGEMLFEGASSSSIKITPEYNETTFESKLRVDLDVDGDKVYELRATQGQAINWNSPNGFLENQPPEITATTEIRFVTRDAPSLDDLRVDEDIYIWISATDPEGQEISTYIWTLESAPAGSNIQVPSNSNTFTIITTDIIGDYSISVKATDEDGFSSVEFINFTVLENQVPIAILTDETGTPRLGTRISLNADESYDTELDSLNYLWTITAKPQDSNISLDASTERYSYVSFFPDVSGTYSFSLVVSDQVGGSSEVQTISVLIPDNQAPTAKILDNSEFHKVGSYIVLRSESSDSDRPAYELNHSWVLSSKPSGSVLPLATDDLEYFQLTIIPDVAGSYTFELTSADRYGGSDTKSITLEITN